MIKNISQIKAGIFLSYLSSFLGLIIGLLYTPIMIRLLGQSEYGLYNIAASIVSYLGVLNFGFGSAYMRYYSKYKANENNFRIKQLNGMFLIIFSILGLIAILAGVSVAFNVELIFGKSLNIQELQTAKLLMLILVINLGFSFPNIVFDNYMQANERFIAQYILQILRQVSTPLLILPLLLMGYGSVGMVVVTTIVNIIVEIFTTIYCFIKLDMKFYFKSFDLELFKEVIIYSSFIFLNMIVDIINNTVDKTLIGRYQGASSVAIYSVGLNIKVYFQQLSTTISSVFTPRVHQMISKDSNDHEMTLLFTKIGRIQFMVLSLVFMGFIFFGKVFVTIWVGADYEQSYFVALLLMISVYIPLFQNLGIEIQRAKNKHQFRSWLYFGIAIANVFISIPLIIKYDAIGGALGTAVTMVLGNGLSMNLYNHYKIGLNMKFFWIDIIKILPSFIPVIIFGVVINTINQPIHLISLIINGVIFVIIYCLSIWSFALNEYEKQLVKSPFK